MPLEDDEVGDEVGEEVNEEADLDAVMVGRPRGPVNEHEGESRA